MAIPHGSFVVCGDPSQQWYGWTGRLSNADGPRYGVQYALDPDDIPPATGRWTKRELIYLPDQLPTGPDFLQAVERFRLWSTLFEKARESALLAVETFNRPTASFRTGAYTTLMIIAWTSLLLALIVRERDDPYEYDEQGNRLPVTGGGFRFIGIHTCVERYFWTKDSGITSNLELFIRLRNGIEHADVPGLEEKIFGEAQALLINFERILTTEFGKRFALVQGLAFPITFSYTAPEKRMEAMKRTLSAGQRSVFDFVDAYRSSLTAEMLGSAGYAFRVFMIPRTVNHPGNADVAIQWIDTTSDDPETIAVADEHIAALLRLKHVEVANRGRYKPGDVAKIVQRVLGRVFDDSFHHSKACKALGAWKSGARPQQATDCDNRYCCYDETFRACTYTKAWVKLLTQELADPEKQREVYGWELRPTRCSTNSVDCEDTEGERGSGL